MITSPTAARSAGTGSTSEVFWCFLKLGCTSFGGPVAHLGYFYEVFVSRRKWIAEDEYADLVALCQFLPGPASSQVGFAIGLRRAGIAGAFAAWLGFTLPSALLMLGFALGINSMADFYHAGWIAGLKLAAVGVVANAIWNMASKLCPDRDHALIAIAAACLLLILQDPLWQIAAILLGAALGWLRFRNTAAVESPPTTVPCQGTGSLSPRTGIGYFFAFFALLFGLPLLHTLFANNTLALIEAFYRSGALVFGGGHVILPLLDTATVDQGWVQSQTFLAGYGAAQAVPGPLFSFAAYLGAVVNVGPGAFLGAAIALVAAFAGSWLLILGTLPHWHRLRSLKPARAALMGTNAAVLGLLIAAFYDPIWSSAILSPTHLAFAFIIFALLRFTNAPVWALVIASAAAGWIAF